MGQACGWDVIEKGMNVIMVTYRTTTHGRPKKRWKDILICLLRRQVVKLERNITGLESCPMLCSSVDDVNQAMKTGSQQYDLCRTSTTARTLVSRKLPWDGHVTRIEMGLFVNKPMRKRLIGRPRRKWQFDFKAVVLVYQNEEFEEIAQDHIHWWALVSAVLQLLVPLPEIYCCKLQNEQNGTGASRAQNP